MTLRIVARSKGGKSAYAEEVTDVKQIKPHYMTLLKNPVEYIDLHGHVWHCEKSDIVSCFDGVKVIPAICKGVYRLEY